MASLLRLLDKIANNKQYFNASIVVVIITGYILLLLLPFSLSNQSLCLFKNITGIPCPGCGMGRSTYMLLHGNVKLSMYFHPLGIAFNIFLIVSLVWATYDLLNSKDGLMKILKRPLSTFGLVSLLVILLIVWVRNIVIDI